MTGYSGTNVFYSVLDEVSGDYVVVGCETSATATTTNPLIDITCKHSKNFREISNDNGIRTQDDTIELLVFDEVGINILKDSAGSGVILDFREINEINAGVKDFKAKVVSIAQTNPNGAAATFSVTLNSSEGFGASKAFSGNVLHYSDGSTINVVSGLNGSLIGTYLDPNAVTYSGVGVHSVTSAAETLTFDVTQVQTELRRFLPNSQDFDFIQSISSISSFTIDAGGNLIVGTNLIQKFEGFGLNNPQNLTPPSDISDITITRGGNLVTLDSNGDIIEYDGFSLNALTTLSGFDASSTKIDVDRSGNLITCVLASPFTAQPEVTVYDGISTTVLVGSFNLPTTGGEQIRGIANAGRLI